MTTTDSDSRARLLAAGKTLIARLGFENTSTAAIAREAGTSESQLVRYFGSKAGLLEGIFDECWRPLNARVRDLLTDAPDSRRAVTSVLAAVLSVFEQDSDLAQLFLLEGRRIRGGSHEVRMSAGSVEFSDIVHRLIRRGQKDGSFATALDAEAMAAALIGAVEGMIRERMLARRDGAIRSFSDRQLHRIFGAMLDGFAPQPTRVDIVA
jgi:AcrR family transcriptional regulator